MTGGNISDAGPSRGLDPALTRDQPYAGRPESPITIIGANPAIDRIFDVPDLELGSDDRSRRTLHVAGGKPMNVARSLRRLGYACRLASIFH
jgi:hypothetical protein